MSGMARAAVALITGSGMNDRFRVGDRVLVRTEFGPVTLYRCTTHGEDFFLLPRHGLRHTLPPHMINFRANLKALESVGVGSVFATSAVGSISGKLRVGEIGLVDQFIDFSSRHLTYFDSRPAHVDMTTPYDKALQRVVLGAAREAGQKMTRGLVYVSVDGPRYETAAEIRAFRLLGGDVVGMTGAPEVILARELGIAYASVVVATNMAAGLQPKVSHDEVEDVMDRAGPRLKHILELSLKAANRI